MALAPVAECLDEETIAAFVAGSLDPALLARVESHVGRCAACEQVVADAAYGAIAKTSGSTPVLSEGDPDRLEASGEVPRDPASVRWATPPPRPGDVLAEKYRVERVLGQGGMGTVLSAVHLELGNRVAIKVLHFGGAAAAARFLREAQTCAKLGNEHIVRAFDLGRLPGGAPYLVMEYLVGEDLSRLIARGPAPIPEAIRYVLEACEALAEAHAAGIVHRDLKPANLFLAARPSGRPTIKLLDFGISKLLGGAEGGDFSVTLTSTGTVLGSPLYMSPEQIRASRQIDEGTDIWSLGVILYELLTGRAPFHAPTLSSLSVAIATEAPALPSSLRPEIEPRLDAVVMRCLQKDRARRFSSAVALAQALAPFAHASPSLPAGSPVGPTNVSPRSSKSRATALGAGVVVLAASAGAIALLRDGHELSAGESAERAAAATRSIEASRGEESRSLPAELPPRIDFAPSAPPSASAPPATAPSLPKPSGPASSRAKLAGPALRPRPSAPASGAPKPDPTATPD